jgi:hypothetical protein
MRMVICLQIPTVFFNRWKNYFSQLLNVHSVSDVRQIAVHTTESLVPGPNLLEVEIPIGKFKNCKSTGSDPILAELIEAVDEVLSAFHKFIYLVLYKK